MTEPTTHPTPSTQALQNAVLAMPMARTLGLRFVRAEPGATELEMPCAFSRASCRPRRSLHWATLRRCRPQVRCCLPAGPMPRWTAA